MSQGMPYSLYTNCLLDLILTMVIFYDIPENENFQNKLEKVQYRACLAINGAIQGTSRQELYAQLGLHSLSKRRWRNILIFLYKILNGLLPKYLHSYLIFPTQESYPLKSALTNKTNVIPSRTKTFKKAFFPYCINEWNNLNAEVRNTIKFFKKMIVTDKKENSVFSVFSLMIRLKVQEQSKATKAMPTFLFVIIGKFQFTLWLLRQVPPTILLFYI